MVPLLVVLLLLDSLGINWDRLSVEIVAQLDTCEFEKGRRNIGMCSYYVYRLALRYVRPADIERHIDILLEGARLSGLESVLPNVEAIVGSKDDIRVVEKIVLLQASYNLIYKLIDSLQRLETTDMPLIVETDHRVV